MTLPILIISYFLLPLCAMFPPVKNILQRLERLPMLIALAGLVVGIVLADCLRPDVWVVAVGFAVMCAVAYYRRWALVGVVLLVGALSLSLRREVEQLPEGVQLMQLEIISVAHDLPDRLDYNARIVAIGQRRSAVRVRVVAPAFLELQAGERLVVRTKVRGYEEQTSYGRYMQRVGVVGQIYLNRESILQRQMGAESLGVGLRQRAAQHIGRLGLSADVESVVAAISVGERSTITATLRKSYTRAGGAHLLAVSGLHVGFLFVLVNFLLLPMVALRNGQLWRSVVATLVIWLYASMTGFSPSVVRAAVMFTLVQLSLAVGSRRSHLNTLAFAASMMLIWDARMVYDAGFQLSVLAVAAIVGWGVPLTRWLVAPLQGWEGCSWWRRVVRGAWRWSISTIVVSFVASVVTMPLSSYLFGEFSLWSVVVGGVMVVLCAVTVGVALLWVIAPVGFVSPIVAWVLECSAGAMNALAEWCAGSNVMAHQISISLISCWMIYSAFMLFTLALWSLPKRE